MKSILRWAVQSRAAMNLILVVTFLVGLVAIKFLKREVFPNFELEIILVQVPYPGASPEEVEEGICMKIEEAVRSIDGIKQTTAIARESGGFVILEIETRADVQKVMNEIRSEVDRIPSFPELAEDPEYQQVTFRRPAIRLAIVGPDDERGTSPDDAMKTKTGAGAGAGESYTQTEQHEWQLREMAEHVRNDLLELKSVSQVTIIGQRPYQIDVQVSEENLRKYGLTLQKLATSLRQENVEIPGGKIQTSGESILLRGKNKFVRGLDIANIPVVTRRDGTVLTIGDLGTVHDGFDDSTSYSRVNGKPAMVLSVDRTSSEDLLKIVDEVKEYIAAKKLPEHYSLTVWNDTSIDVRERIELLTEDGFQGLVLVFLILAIFLEFRLALWVAMGIPFAILAACAVLFATGGSLNMLTLFSFLMALGILVDDAIVVSENYHTHLTMGKKPAQAAIDAAAEVAPSVIAGVFCTVIAFVPLFFVTGVMGKFIACMPLTVVSMLLISLVEGFTILPCHLGHEGITNDFLGTCRGIRQASWNAGIVKFLLGGWVAAVVSLILEGIMYFIRAWGRILKAVFDRVNVVADRLVDGLVNRAYLPTVRWLLDRIPLAFALQFAFLAITLTFYRAGWTRYLTFPEMDDRVIHAQVVFPDGTPAQVTDAGVRQAAEAMRRVNARFEAQGTPLITVMHETIGSSGSDDALGSDSRGSGEFVGGVFVELVSAEHRDITAQDIVALWRQETGEITGVEKVSYSVQTLGPGGRDIEFKMLATNEHWEQLARAAERTKLALQKIDGVYDITDDSYEGKWEYQIRLTERGRTMGITTAELAETVRAAFYGEEVMRLQRGRHEVKLMVRYPRDERSHVAALHQIRVRGNDGLERPITELAEFELKRGYSEIQRVDQKRAITIVANVDERITTGGKALQVLQDDCLKELQRDFPFVTIRWEGQKEQDNESIQSLGLGSIVAIGVMFVILTFQLESVLQPLMILYLIPFATAGAIWGHIFMRLDITLFSVFGLVALMGMVVNDSIVLLDFINARLREYPSEPLREAILESSRRRIRPVALNTVTSVIGLIPLLADQSFQAQALIPMGVSLVFGLATSTILGLLILPTLYYVVAQAIPPHRGEPDHGLDRVEDSDVLSGPTLQTETLWDKHPVGHEVGYR